MEKIINIHIKKLTEGVYLATSKDIQGLKSQGRTATEALEIAMKERSDNPNFLKNIAA